MDITWSKLNTINDSDGVIVCLSWNNHFQKSSSATPTQHQVIGACRRNGHLHSPYLTYLPMSMFVEKSQISRHKHRSPLALSVGEFPWHRNINKIIPHIRTAENCCSWLKCWNWRRHQRKRWHKCWIGGEGRYSSDSGWRGRRRRR